MKYNCSKILIFIAMMYFSQSSCVNTDKEIDTIFFSSTENAATLEHYLTHVREEEYQIAGFDYSKPLDTLQNTLEITDFASLATACVSKIKDERIQYNDGHVRFLNTASNSLIALESILSLCGIGCSLALIKKEGLGFLLAKCACSGLAVGVGALAIRNVVKKLRKESYTSFDKEGLTYTCFDQSGKLNSENRLTWSQVKDAHIVRTVKIDKANRTSIEQINVQLRDDSDKVLLSFSNIYFPVRVERFLELVSYFKAEALSLTSSCLPMVIETKRWVK